MKILFCSPNPLVEELGASKVLIGIAEELNRLGWSCKFIEPSDLLGETWTKLQRRDLYRYIIEYAEHLRQYLHQHASEYDVVDYDHIYLPYPRTEFAPRTLLVARSVLLAHYLKSIALPQPITWRATVRSWLKGKAEKDERSKIVECAGLTVRQADLVNVSNHNDKAELVRCGISPEKIIVLPYGLSDKRRILFDIVTSEPSLNPIVTFVGTFDNRKGSTDIPVIFEGIFNRLLKVRFRLLGTGRTVQNVLANFPKWMTQYIEVIPSYSSEELPKLLAPCSVGIFPSYFEGFPFGVLEMLAASVPVIAYNSPGAPMMLSSEYLVPPGDTDSLSAKVITLLSNPDKLADAQALAKQRSQQFSWQKIAKKTTKIYLKKWQKLNYD